MKNSLFSFSTGLFVFVLLFVSTSHGQTFRIDGPKTYNFTTGVSNKSIILKNNTATNYKIYARIENNTNGQIEFYPDIIDMLDTGTSVGSEIIVNFIARGPAVVNARIILFDSVATRDTIYINGQDARYHDTANPFRLHVINDLKEIPTGGTDSSRFIYFDHGTTPWEYSFYVINYTPSPLGVVTGFTGPGKGFSLIATASELEVYPSAKGAGLIKVAYDHTGNQRDTGILVFTTGAPYPKTDTLVFIGRDTTYREYPKIKGDTVDFGWLHPGEESYVQMYIQNPYPKQTISIMQNVKAPNNGPGFGITIWHSLPFTIPAGKKDSFSVTFTAPQEQGVVSVARSGFAYMKPDFTLDTMWFVFIGRTRECYPLEPKATLTMESAIPEGYTDASFTLDNNGSTPITISSVSFAEGYFSAFFSLRSPTLPVTIPANTKQQMKVRFAPQHLLFADAAAIMTIGLDPNSVKTGCTDVVYQLLSSTISADDTTIIPLYPNQTASLPMASTADTMINRFTFKNNLTVPVKVLSVDVGTSGHFTITSINPSPLPVELVPDGLLTVDVLFDAGTNGYYTDDLVIVTENALTSQTFRLKALRTNGLPQGVEHSAEAELSLNIYPNPATSIGITCTAPIGTKKIAIFDVLGNLVAQKEHTSEWSWTPVSSNGTSVSPGVYFVRAEGQNEGKSFVISKKLVIER